MEYGDRRIADHINRVRLDNRRSNLRIAATRYEQMQNVTPRVGYTSEHRGVYWDKYRQRWAARGKVNGVKSFLGRFKTEEEAAAVAKAWRRENMPFSEEALCQ